MRTKLLVALYILVGCSKEKTEADHYRELFAKQAPLIRPKLAALENVAKTPFPSPSGTIKAGEPRPEWANVRIDSFGNVEKSVGNAAFAFDVDLAKLGTDADVKLRTSNVSFMNDCYRTINAGESPPGGGSTFHLHRCALVKYLIVAKVTDVEWSGGVMAGSDEFRPGQVKADLAIFDLDNGGAHLGGIAISATNSEKVRVGESITALDQDLRSNFYKAIERGVPVLDVF